MTLLDEAGDTLEVISGPKAIIIEVTEHFAEDTQIARVALDNAQALALVNELTRLLNQ